MMTKSCRSIRQRSHSRRSPLSRKPPGRWPRGRIAMSMNAAAYVGRVGGLAVALGVGAAVVTGYGCGVAWADTPDSSSSKPSSTSESSTNAEPRRIRRKQPRTPPRRQPNRQRVLKPRRRRQGRRLRKPRPASSSAPAAPTRVRSSKDDEETTAPTKDPAPPKGEPAAESGKSAHAAVESTGTPAPVSKVDAVEVKVDAVEVKVDADPQPALKSVPEADVPISSFAAQTMSSTTEMRTAAVTTAVTPPAVPSLRPWPTAFDPGTVVTYVGGLVSSVVSAVLSPFAAGLPAAPADPPTVWTLLAWVRRELFNASPRITPVINPQTNGLITGNIGAVDPDGDPLTYTVDRHATQRRNGRDRRGRQLHLSPDERDGRGRWNRSVHGRGQRRGRRPPCARPAGVAEIRADPGQLPQPRRR